jgi:diacylglycerol kinase (ATP)
VFEVPRKQVKLIVNPNADLGRAWRLASDLRPMVAEYGGADWIGTVYPTHATELARQAAEDGYELIIAAGGDGTVHEIINGLMQVPRDKRPRLGIVPLGSGNDFSSAVGMEPYSMHAIRQILEGQPRQIDVGVLRDGRGRTEYWDNAIGIGFDATVVIRSRQVPVVRGFLIYLIAVLQTILLNHDAPRLKVKTDQEEWEEEMLLLVLCNGGREGGGFKICPAARPDDGILHYTSVGRVSRSYMMRLLPKFMKGTHAGARHVRMGQFKKLELSSDRPLTIHTDGEIFAGFGVDVRQLSVEIVPNALEVLTAPKS